jgi:GNAT superfamily N-acetyltransferase
MASALTSSGSPRVAYRQATAADVPAMGASRLTDPSAGPADSRMTAFLEGTHHPYQALEPRVAFVAVQEDTVIGYIAGHLTRRYYCDGEVQYLYVALPHRRSGIATELLRRLATWFTQRGAIKICVNVNIESPGALPFYSRHGATAINKYWVVWDDIRALCEDSTTSAVPIESRRLKLVPQTLEDVRATDRADERDTESGAVAGVARAARVAERRPLDMGIRHRPARYRGRHRNVRLQGSSRLRRHGGDRVRRHASF